VSDPLRAGKPDDPQPGPDTIGKGRSVRFIDPPGIGERFLDFVTRKNQFYIERSADGNYVVRRGGSQRASAVARTQAEAIERAKQIDPKAPIHVERVRNTKESAADNWRKR
jgi:hypothetical protein